MNILSLLNVSNVDNIECDSGFVFQKMLGRSLTALGHTFTLALPFSPAGLEFQTRYHFFGGDKFHVRYAFQWEKMHSLVEETKAAVILSNQPELSSNLRAMLISRKIDAKIFTYVHYFPFAIDDAGGLIYDSSLDNSSFCRSIVFSFISGLLASDMVLVHSKYAQTLLQTLFRHFNVDGSGLGIVILPPPFDKFLAEIKAGDTSEPGILYNHRLYKQYGTGFLLEFATGTERRFNWKITITDTLYNRNGTRAHLDQTVDEYRSRLAKLTNIIFRQDGNDRNTYRSIINASKIGLAPYRRNCTWSMSIIDCMSAGLPVLAPDFSWFQEFIPAELRYNTIPELISTTKRLFRDKPFYREMSESVRQRILTGRHLEPETIAKKLVTLFNM